MRKNILLLILALSICLVIAPYLGNLYDRIDPQYGGWISDKEGALLLAGFLLAYTLVVPFVFKLIGTNNQNKWITGLVFPVILIYIGYNWRLVFIPSILGVTGFILAKLIRFTISKFKHPNPPMVVK